MTERADKPREAIPGSRPEEDARSKSANEQETVQGEGNYDAARTYNESTREFVASGQVEEAAREAAPADEGEAAELLQAEQAGKDRAKEEDPAVDRGESRAKSSG